MNCDDGCHRDFIFLSKVLQFNFMNGFLLFPSLPHNNKKTSLQSRFTFYARSRTQIMFPVRRESNGVSITLKIISEEYFLFSSKVICVNEACNNSRKNRNEKNLTTSEMFPRGGCFAFIIHSSLKKNPPKP